MNPKLFLLLNHQITADQEANALKSLPVSMIVEPPTAIKVIWKRVPPEVFFDITHSFRSLPMLAWPLTKSDPFLPIKIEPAFAQ